jgi:hypothetical protein
MENNVVDLIAINKKASEVSDQIKDHLYAKAAEGIEAMRPQIASSMFSEPKIEDEPTIEPEQGEEENVN